MKLAINGRFLSQKTTGVQRMAREFTRALDRLIAEGAVPGVSARLLVQPGAVFGDLALGAIKVETIAGLRGHAWEQFVLPRHINREDWLINLGNTAPVASLIASRRVAVVLHDISYRVFPNAYRLRYRFSHRLLNMVLMRRADPVITVAETERAMIGRFYPRAAHRIIVAPNGGWSDDEVAAARSVPTAAEPPYGIYVGSLSKRKNIQGVLALAIDLARTRGIRFKLVGAASPILAEANLSLPDDVAPMIDYVGQIESAEQLKALYRNAAFLLFPSFYEASALPPIEAMAQSCPVIVSNIASLIERCGDAALYCDASSPASMRDAVDRLLDDGLLAQELIARGRERAARLTWRTQTLTVLEALKICEERNR